MKYYPPYAGNVNLEINDTQDETRSIDNTYITLSGPLYYFNVVQTPVLYTEYYKINYENDSIEFSIDTTLSDPILATHIQYKIPFHIQNLKTYDQMAISDTTHLYTDTTSYTVFVNSLYTLDNTNAFIKVNNVEDISNIEIEFLIGSNLDMTTNGSLASGIVFVSGDSTKYPHIFSKTDDSSYTYAEIYKLDNDNVAIDLSNDILLDTSSISLSNLQEDNEYLLLITRRIDPDLTSSIIADCTICNYNNIEQDDITNFTSYIDLVNILESFNETIDITYSNDFSDTSSTHELLLDSTGLVAKILFDSIENSLYRTKKIIFDSSESDLETVVKIFDGNDDLVYDETTIDFTTELPIKGLENEKYCKIKVYIIGFEEGNNYSIKFNMSLFPFFDNKYTTSGLIDKLLEVPDSTEDVTYSPEYAIVFFGGLSQ